MTVAMLLAERGLMPPNLWLHDPMLTDNQGYTVAMLIADCCN